MAEQQGVARPSGPPSPPCAARCQAESTAAVASDVPAESEPSVVSVATTVSDVVPVSDAEAVPPVCVVVPLAAADGDDGLEEVVLTSPARRLSALAVRRRLPAPLLSWDLCCHGWEALCRWWFEVTGPPRRAVGSCRQLSHSAGSWQLQQRVAHGT